MSGRRANGLRDSSTFLSVTRSAAIPIGMLTKKIHRHEMPLVISPPSTGPTATATPVIAPSRPKATALSRPWKACAIRASEVANMIAPPTPCPARAAMRNTGPLARPQASDPAVNTARPIANNSRRPNMSASEPAMSRNAARVRA